jgi:hypothetical protein
LSICICIKRKIKQKGKVKKPRNADPVRRKNAPTPSDEVIEARLKSLLEPVVLGQQGYARLLGRRERILSSPVMVARRC